MQSVNIGNNQAGQRLDKFLHKLMPEAGTGFLYKMLRKKNITLNGKKAEGAEILKQGDRVSFYFSDETFQKFTGEAVTSNSDDSNPVSDYERAFRTLRGIDVIYEDENILIASKPAGILSQKAEKTDLSLNEWLIGYLLAAEPSFKDDLSTFHPSVCNRLDRNTSGIVLCGKSLAGSQYLSECIKNRSIRKFYRTICVGKLKQDASIKGYLKKDTARNRVTIQEQADTSGRQDAIETVYHPLSCSGSYTMLEVELITGKTHQIRAHLASIGHPLIGDYKYGNEKTNRRLRETFHLKHQLLHARKIVFPPCHEGIGAGLSRKEFYAPYPVEFQSIAEGLGLKTKNKVTDEK